MKTLPYILACIFLYGLSTFLRKLSLDRIHPYQLQVISAYVYVLAAPIWMWLLHDNNIKGYDIKGSIYGVACIMVYTAAAVIFGFAIKQSDNVGVGTALVSLSPIVTISLSYLFLNETLSITKIIAFVFAILSAIIVNL